MKINYAKLMQGFLLQWLLAIMIGTLMGMAIMFLGLAPFLNKSPQVGPLLYGGGVGVVLGASVGTAQWLVLRRYLNGVGEWLWLTLLGWVIFGVLEFSGGLSSLVGENSGIAFVPDVLHLAIFGFLVGVLQWLFLRQKVQAAGWWVLASIAGAILGAIVADGINLVLRSDSPLDFLAGSILWGIITGVCMTRLLHQPIATPSMGTS